MSVRVLADIAPCILVSVRLLNTYQFRLTMPLTSVVHMHANVVVYIDELELNHQSNVHSFVHVRTFVSG